MVIRDREAEVVSLNAGVITMAVAEMVVVMVVAMAAEVDKIDSYTIN